MESSERRTTQDPEALWDRVGLAEGEVVVDVGAGTGYFAFPAARRVGANGHVYAVDLSEELVGWLGERRDRERIPQLEPIRSSVDAIPLASGCADVVLLANVLHDVPSATVDEAVRLLKPHGRFVNVDWRKEPTPGGPPLGARLTEEEAVVRLASHGLVLLGRWRFGPWHYGLTLRGPGGELIQPIRGSRRGT